MSESLPNPSLQPYSFIRLILLTYTVDVYEMKKFFSKVVSSIIIDLNTFSSVGLCERKKKLCNLWSGNFSAQPGVIRTWVAAITLKMLSEWILWEKNASLCCRVNHLLILTHTKNLAFITFFPVSHWCTFQKPSDDDSLTRCDVLPLLLHLFFRTPKTVYVRCLAHSHSKQMTESH